VFIRKFGFSGKSPEELLIKEYTKNGDVVVELLKYLMHGTVTCAFTGPMGSGKTTLMTSVIRYIDPRFSIRTLEMAFEMYLRNLYPYRNMLGVQETPSVSAAILQDALKKTDGVVSIVGEVASDDVAARMLQMAQVASRYTLFSHHATTARNLVMALRNSLVNAAGFSMDTAERQVVDVIKIDVHLDVTPDGKRYISRITEIVPLPPGIPYPEYDGTQNSMNKVTKEYYERSTDRTAFTTRDILTYDLSKHTYHKAGWFSKELSGYILQNLDEKSADGFRTLAAQKWGVKI
jgi:pilus assembly protein CpaF